MSKMIIVVDGGMVTSVVPDDQYLDVEVLDYDNMKVATDEELDGYEQLEKERYDGLK